MGLLKTLGLARASELAAARRVIEELQEELREATKQLGNMDDFKNLADSYSRQMHNYGEIIAGYAGIIIPETYEGLFIARHGDYGYEKQINRTKGDNQTDILAEAISKIVGDEKICVISSHEKRAVLTAKRIGQKVCIMGDVNELGALSPFCYDDKTVIEKVNRILVIGSRGCKYGMVIGHGGNIENYGKIVLSTFFGITGELPVFECASGIYINMKTREYCEIPVAN